MAEINITMNKKTKMFGPTQVWEHSFGNMLMHNTYPTPNSFNNVFAETN